MMVTSLSTYLSLESADGKQTGEMVSEYSTGDSNVKMAISLYCETMQIGTLDFFFEIIPISTHKCSGIKSPVTCHSFDPLCHRCLVQ